MAVPQRKYADNIIGFPAKRKPPINKGFIVAVFLVVLLAAGAAFVKDVSTPDQPLPETGAILRSVMNSSGEKRELPFTVIADPINHYVFKLSSEANELVLFVRKGEKAEIRVPEGKYLISWAYGTRWKGMDDLFWVTNRVRGICGAVRVWSPNGWDICRLVCQYGRPRLFRGSHKQDSQKQILKHHTKGDFSWMDNIMGKGDLIVHTMVPAAVQKELAFSAYPKDDRRGCLGHLRGDFGRDGTEFWTTWNPCDETLKTDAFRFEFDLLVNALRENVLMNFAYMARFCNQNAEGSDISDQHWLDNEYVFSMHSEQHTYFLRCIKRKGDYNFYIYCYNTTILEKYLKEEGKNA